MDGEAEARVFGLVGAEGFTKLTAAFYHQVPDDPILGPMYPADEFPEAEARLRSFLIYRFGGPPDYILERGHPRLRMRHAPFQVNHAARDRWIQLMERALSEVDFPEEADQTLRKFFDHMATFLINVPE